MKLISGLAAVTLAASTLVTAPSGAATPTEPAGVRTVSAGASWLAAQLTDGIVVGEFDGFVYDDFGLSADVAFALDAVGGQDATVVAIADAVAPKVTQWYDFAPTVYTGSAAKAIALAQVAGREASDFGGTDLQSVVEANVATSAPITGRVQNTGETDWSTGDPTDSLNVISQSWAARALGGQGSDLADEVMSFLLDQQCDDGSFRAALTKDKAAPEQGCAAGDVGEVDTTALTVINILETPDAPLAARGAALLAASWLRTQQASDGSFSAGALGANANTTGIAGWALAEAGHDGAATKAAGWLRGLQVADLAPCASTLSAENGAIAYKTADLAAARTAGKIPATLQDAFRRASAQALPALAHVPAGGDVAVSAPATAVERSTVTVNVAGLGAGEPACVSLGGRATPVTGTGSVVPVEFTLPSGTVAHTFRVTTLTGSATATTTATAAPNPVVPSPVVGDLAVAKVEKVGRNNRFEVAVTCDGAVACAGKLKVRTARRVERADGTKARLVIAKSAYAVQPGRTRAIRLELTKPSRALLGKKRIRVLAVQTARGAEPVATKFWLRRK
ncbi:hypothetical protein GCM10011376_32300 [Nocardioides flavus (ex Wang et al. 2016)]|uniref:Prenyltransferase and squalene oxidase repeat-containing protein n=1 Tax=Nocardioides flavus (ex Wang et al. 2016) TaxID=2058780 RepID=A0ABQ3HLQ7_9ACTN|nr:hypothetical protein [Nocardioides flavus (ex Wang et al. 2016)]GHE18620.1 hypothetical protein GCM10011376_32300 [Nocardioides flavus (ex Wang et al. 2016)]